ncbi:phasin family protein [Altererythrobacter atlanticus]|uniref:Phasin protein n=1 Tax=Croceibacterium atlanticum TaxID=1267766 RepID=A0A0F7KPY6_9SPHN|nr:phasin family protein [Croceibacterium atlanticum]AKH42598.1 Phasin protein [Croceibacterium atlanticum]MBB5731375.1 phasin family protein [Croceibacterium atlanticum]
MADSPDKKTEDSAEKAYAAAASEMKPKAAADPKASEPAPAKAEPKTEARKAEGGEPAKQAAPAKVPARKPAAAKKTAAKKAAAKSAPKRKASAKKAAKVPAPKPAAEPNISAMAAKKPAKVAQQAANTPQTTVSELKDKIMATAKTPDYSNMLTEMQSKAKEAYDKGTEAMGEASEFAKGNVEALVESSKILAGGLQDMSKTVVDEAKSAYETMTADMKEMAAVKSPTELFQLQGKIMRRNFDALVATSSKNSETMMKLANEAFAPISGRMNMAAEKMSKAAA